MFVLFCFGREIPSRWFRGQVTSFVDKPLFACHVQSASELPALRVFQCWAWTQYRILKLPMTSFTVLYLWDLHALPASACEYERACAVRTWSCHKQQPKFNSSVQHMHHCSAYCLWETQTALCDALSNVQCTDFVHCVQCTRSVCSVYNAQGQCIHRWHAKMVCLASMFWKH